MDAISARNSWEVTISAVRTDVELTLGCGLRLDGWNAFETPTAAGGR